VVGDTEFLNDLQWLLVEVQDGGVTWLSGLWTPEEVLASVNRVQSEFLRRTEITAAWAILPVTANVGDVTVPQDYILASEALFADTTALVPRATPLARSDEWELDRAIPTWEETPAAPLVYGDGISDDVLQLTLGPTPSVAGILYLLYIACGAPISNDGTTEFTVPDEAVITILWGVLADLLDKVGRGEDLSRAQYCHARFEEGVLVWTLSLQGVLG
jgi:hypothetical protein